MRLAGLVLAAGASTRFGGDKLAARFEGRSMLDHVVDALREVPIHAIVVVTRPNGPMALLAKGVMAVENPTPDAGLSSSLRAGLAAIVALPGPGLDAVVIALGDQPLIEPSQIRKLVDAAVRTTRPIVVPRYRHDAGRNPVLLRRDAFELVDHATGDRGLGPVLDAHPELVLEVVADGQNPDIDTPADLARIVRASRGRGSGERGR
jgi:CTP:molybdopterin cytidylyltransferase MocA